MVKNEGEQQLQNKTRGEGGSDAGTEDGAQKWRKPIFGELKLKCDAAWRSDTKRGGSGGCFGILLRF